MTTSERPAAGARTWRRVGWISAQEGMRSLRRGLLLRGDRQRQVGFVVDLALAVGHAPLGAVDLEVARQRQAVRARRDLRRETDLLRLAVEGEFPSDGVAGAALLHLRRDEL